MNVSIDAVTEVQMIDIKSFNTSISDLSVTY